MRLPAAALYAFFLLVLPAACRASEGHEHAETVVVKVGNLDEAVNAVAYFQREIDALLEKNELPKIHTAAFAARDAATSAVALATSLPAQAQRELNLRAQKIAELAVQLDKYGDAGKAAETAVFARKLREEVEALRGLTGVAIRADFKPEVVQAAGGGHSSRCPHKARHGGRFTMALNDAYHVEGVYPEPGVFRLYFYDSESCEIPATPFTGRLLFQEGEIPLEPAGDGSYLTAKLPQAPQPPVSMTAIVRLPHPGTGQTAVEHYSYNFYRLSKPASAAGSGAGVTTATAASHP